MKKKKEVKKEPKKISILEKRVLILEQKEKLEEQLVKGRKKNIEKKEKTSLEKYENAKKEALAFMSEEDIKPFYTTIDLCRAKWFPYKSPSTVTIWCNEGKIKGINISLTGKNRYKISLAEVINFLKTL